MRNLKPISFFIIMWLIAILAGWIFAPATASSQPPYVIPDFPPRPPDGIPLPERSLVERRADLPLPDMQAVLLVGPIDGNTGEWTLSEIDNMELAASVLEANGVTVQRFYPGDSNFAEIEAAANGAEFLLYRGHGVYDGNMPYPNVGGFYLSSGFYSAERIRSNLHLAENAIVMLYGCFTAGSSSAAGDDHDIGISEASRRVAQYSDPFFDIGAAGYYANWFGNAFEQFLINLFAGQTLGKAYENYFDFNAQSVFRTTHPDHPGLAMWVDKDNWGYWKYNNAFAGKQGSTLVDLFPTAELSGLPDQLTFYYSIPSQVFLTDQKQIIPVNIGNELQLNISMTADSPWIEINPQTGTTSQAFSVSASGFDLHTPALYEGAISVSAVAPSSGAVAQSPQSVAVILHVLETPIYRKYLPLITFP